MFVVVVAIRTITFCAVLNNIQPHFLQQSRSRLMPWLYVKQEGLLTPTAQRAACETWNAHPSYWGSVHLGSNFTEIGSSPAKMLIPFDRQLIALQFCCWNLSDAETLQQTFIGFWSKFLRKKRQTWVSEPHFGDVKGDVWPWLMALW